MVALHLSPLKLTEFMQPSLTPSIFIRSCLFHAVVVVWFSACILLLPGILLAPRSLVKRGFDLTIFGYLGLLKHICRQTYELRGRQNIPLGPVLYASKHLSKWDSAALPILLGDPAVVLRREMLWFPLYGSVILRLGHLAVPRSADPAAAEQLLREARSCIESGRSVLIFPEGTRTSTLPFSPPAYKRGVAALYKVLRVPCVPIAVNSGLFWPRHTLIRYPGKIVAEILPPIEPGLDPSEFMHELIHQLETNSQRLVCEGLATSPA